MGDGRSNWYEWNTWKRNHLIDYKKKKKKNGVPMRCKKDWN